MALTKKIHTCHSRFVPGLGSTLSWCVVMLQLCTQPGAYTLLPLLTPEASWPGIPGSFWATGNRKTSKTVSMSDCWIKQHSAGLPPLLVPQLTEEGAITAKSPRLWGWRGAPGRRDVSSLKAPRSRVEEEEVKGWGGSDFRLAGEASWRRWLQRKRAVKDHTQGFVSSSLKEPPSTGDSERLLTLGPSCRIMPPPLPEYVVPMHSSRWHYPHLAQDLSFFNPLPNQIPGVAAPGQEAVGVWGQGWGWKGGVWLGQSWTHCKESSPLLCPPPPHTP